MPRTAGPRRGDSRISWPSVVCPQGSDLDPANRVPRPHDRSCAADSRIGRRRAHRGGRPGRCSRPVLKLVRRTLDMLSPKYQRRVLVLVIGAFGVRPGRRGRLRPALSVHPAADQPVAEVPAAPSGSPPMCSAPASRHTLEVRLGVTILVLFILSSVLGIALDLRPEPGGGQVRGRRLDPALQRLPPGALRRAPRAQLVELVRNVHNAVGDIHQLVLMSMLIISGNMRAGAHHHGRDVGLITPAGHRRGRRLLRDRERRLLKHRQPPGPTGRPGVPRGRRPGDPHLPGGLRRHQVPPGPRRPRTDRARSSSAPSGPSPATATRWCTTRSCRSTSCSRR